MISFLNILILVPLLVLAYAWIAYPLIVMGLARIRKAREAASPPGAAIESGRGGGLDARVSIILSAYNEETVIGDRIRNLAEAVRNACSSLKNISISVYVGIDGSSDHTAEKAREAALELDGFHIEEFKEQQGKVAVLKRLAQSAERRAQSAERIAQSAEGRKYEENNEAQSSSGAMRHAPCALRESSSGAMRSSLLVFTDANTVFRPDALEKLLAQFTDSRVGGVCGRLVLEEKAEGGNLKPEELESGIQNKSAEFQVSSFRFPPSSFSSESLYWQMETRLKQAESDVDSCLGANGAIYAIRADLFPCEIPENTIVDDFVIGMKVREAGFRMVYEPAAVAKEELPSTADEWRRRVRIGAGDFQSLELCRKCLSPGFGAFACMFFSHKVLRWFTPHVILALIAACMVSVGAGSGFTVQGSRFTVYGPVLVLAGVVMFLLLALVGNRIRALSLFRHFVVMQAALFAGFIRYCRGNLRGSWERTPRARLKD